MSTLWYYTDEALSGTNHQQLIRGGAAPAGGALGNGWEPGQQAAGLSAPKTLTLNSQFGPVLQPAGHPDNAIGDCYRSESALTLVFPAGTWDFWLNVIGGTLAADHGASGRARVRLWKATRADGVQAVEISPEVGIGTTLVDIDDTAHLSQVAWVMPRLVFDAEYLLVQVAWEITDILTAGATAQVGLLKGTNSRLVTPDPEATLTPTTNPRKPYRERFHGNVSIDGDVDVAGAVSQSGSPLSALYQLASEKGVASGYAGLSAAGVVPDAQLAGMVIRSLFLGSPVTFSQTSVHAAVTDNGAPQTITTGITNPDIPRIISAQSGGVSGDIKAIAVTIHGTNAFDEVISEVLPVFTVNTPTSVLGAKAFKTVTSIDIPAHDGTGATTSIGWANKFGVGRLFSRNTVVKSFFGTSTDTTSILVDPVAIENNTISPTGTPDGVKALRIDYYA